MPPRPTESTAIRLETTKLVMPTTIKPIVHGGHREEGKKNQDDFFSFKFVFLLKLTFASIISVHSGPRSLLHSYHLFSITKASMTE